MQRVLHIIVFACYLLSPLFASSQVITTVAGTGSPGFTGDGGPATAAQLYFPEGLAADQGGNLYFTDQENNRIRKIDADGNISTIAGSSMPTMAGGYGGDLGPATMALLNNPWGVATDRHGNIYTGDWANNRVRKIDTNGIITTIAGDGVQSFTGDGGPATTARLNNPIGVAADGKGDVFIADRGNYRIRMIDTAGIINTMAGNGGIGFAGEGIAATGASMNYPSEIAVDAAGNLYLSDPMNYRVRKVDATGIITTIAGTGASGFGGDGAAATDATLNQPEGIAVDACGNVYFEDGANYRIRKINYAGIITTVAGTGTGGFSGDGGDPTLAQIAQTRGIATDKWGNIYLAELDNHIRKITVVTHAPAFAAGHVQTIDVCADSAALSLDSLLEASDLDTGQTEIWTVILPPVNGTVTGAFTTATTGAMLLPTGIAYTPTVGYEGIDSFKVAVTDCASLADTTTIYVNVNPCGGALNTKTVVSTQDILLYPNPAADEITLSARFPISHFSITDMQGQELFNHECSTTQVTVNISTLPPGIYLVRINGTVVKKFEKE